MADGGLLRRRDEPSAGVVPVRRSAPSGRYADGAGGVVARKRKREPAYGPGSRGEAGDLRGDARPGRERVDGAGGARRVRPGGGVPGGALAGGVPGDGRECAGNGTGRPPCGGRPVPSCVPPAQATGAVRSLSGVVSAAADSSARRSMPLVVFSGFSFRKTTATSASSANGVATRNRSAVATP